MKTVKTNNKVWNREHLLRYARDSPVGTLNGVGILWGYILQDSD